MYKCTFPIKMILIILINRFRFPCIGLHKFYGWIMRHRFFFYFVAMRFSALCATHTVLRQ